MKNTEVDDNRFRRINVRKISSLKDLFNKPIVELEFKVNDKSQIEDILNLVKERGETVIKIRIKDKNDNLIFKLKNKRLVNRKSINLLKNLDISTTIH